MVVALAVGCSSDGDDWPGGAAGSAGADAGADAADVDAAGGSAGAELGGQAGESGSAGTGGTGGLAGTTGQDAAAGASGSSGGASGDAGTSGTGGLDGGAGASGSSGSSGASNACAPLTPCGSNTGGIDCASGCTGLPNCYSTLPADHPTWCACGASIELAGRPDWTMLLGLKDCSSATQPMCGSGIALKFSVPAGHCARFTTSATSPADRFVSTSPTPCGNDACATCIPQQKTCLIAKGATTVYAWANKLAPPGWVRAETAEDWAGSPCPFSCP